MSSSDSGNSNRNYEKLIAFVFSIEAKCILSAQHSDQHDGMPFPVLGQVCQHLGGRESQLVQDHFQERGGKPYLQQHFDHHDGIPFHVLGQVCQLLGGRETKTNTRPFSDPLQD